MKILLKDIRHGKVKVLAETLDDLWYLSKIIDPSDRIRGKAERKVILGGEGERQKSVKKVFSPLIVVEKVDLSEQNILRIKGIIEQGIDEAPQGSHQTIDVKEGTDILIIKSSWLNFHLDYLEQAEKKSQGNILICVHDREEAIFAILKRNSAEKISQIKGKPQKKDENNQKTGDFYGDVIKALEEYSKRYSLEHILLASPAFFKEDLMKKADDDLRKKITLASCSSVSDNAINEVIKRDEVKSVLKDDRIAIEEKLVENLLKLISAKGNAAYGKEEVKKAVEAGAVDIIMITDSYVHKTREKGDFTEIDGMMRKTEAAKGFIRIISSEHDAGKRLDGLGGIAAILRYRVF